MDPLASSQISAATATPIPASGIPTAIVANPRRPATFLLDASCGRQDGREQFGWRTLTGTPEFAGEPRLDFMAPHSSDPSSEAPPGVRIKPLRRASSERCNRDFAVPTRIPRASSSAPPGCRWTIARPRWMLQRPRQPSTNTRGSSARMLSRSRTRPSVAAWAAAQRRPLVRDRPATGTNAPRPTGD